MDTPLPQEHYEASPCLSESSTYGFFNLMGLSVELRTMIYGFVLTRPDPIPLQARHESLQSNSDRAPVPDSPESSTSNSGNPSKDSSDKSITSGNLSPALLRTSQTIYQESRPVLYSRNTFTIFVEDALQALHLLSPSRNLVKHLRFDFLTPKDLTERFPVLARKRLRYFRGLRDLVLIFPQNPSTDWDLTYCKNILSDKPSPASTVARRMLSDSLDWLPISTKVTFIGTNIGQGIGWRRKESAKDEKMEKVLQKIIQKHRLQAWPAST